MARGRQYLHGVAAWLWVLPRGSPPGLRLRDWTCLYFVLGISSAAVSEATVVHAV